MAEEMGGERTESATPRRRDEARKKGQVARSAEINSVLVLAAGVAALIVSLAWMRDHLQQTCRLFFGGIASVDLDNPDDVVRTARVALGSLGTILAPVVLTAFVAGSVAATGQVGIRFSTEAMSVQLDRLNPLPGLKRMAGKQALFDLAKNLLKVSLLALIAVLTLKAALPQVLDLILYPEETGWAQVRPILTKLVGRMLAFMVLLAAIDWAWQKHRYEEQLKMSREEVKREAKDSEGDPQIKARLRSIQLEMARRRMMEDVKKADVIVTNPTHFAVALHYKLSDPAPRVVAKGRGVLAQRIIEVAREARVPVVQRPPLARALYKAVKIGGFVPVKLYEAVATVLAAVMRVGRGAAARGQG